ncbi:glycine cleavage system aminomethyltransferase GcvT [PVC group bacterium]|nr:glycine cleavage system aminomethyltransferase GcvT [PVC group bacterium]
MSGSGEDIHSLHKTPLYKWHVQEKALMAPFGGWAMPIQYRSIIAEHTHTRESVSLFDICHMGEFIVEGQTASQDLDRIVTQAIPSLKIGQCRYGYILNEEAGILDDTIVYKISENAFMMVVNASTLDSDYQWIKKQLRSTTRFRDISAETAKIDIQGALSKSVMTETLKVDCANLNYFHFRNVHIQGIEVLISRTGYTGEWGYELYFPADKAEDLWQIILSDPRVKPAGLGARDTLRLEVGYPLYGQDLTESINPKMCDGMKFVDFKKDFIGHAALNLKESEFILVALLCEGRRSPRHDDKITFNSKEVGTVTSGSFSPSLKRGIALGYVKKEFTPLETPLVIQGEKSALPAIVTQLPFYKEGTARKR